VPRIFEPVQKKEVVAYQPLVTVITIVYNGEKHLEQTIKSVLEQSYSPLEYIIIDGGSKDNSVSIIKKYSDRLAWWTSEKDRGISDAFNKGIAHAKGDIIGLINADDWYEPDAVALAVEALKEADVAYGDMQYWKEGKKDMIVVGDADFLVHEMSVNHPTVFVRADCYRQHGVFKLDYRYAMDYDMMLRLKLNGARFAHVPRVLTNMRWEGVSDQHWHKACREALAIKNKHLPQRQLLNRLYFHKQVASIKMGRFLQRMDLHGTVRFYRKWLSPIRKKYH
jgi:glycosyltransferase involved in cell wall biosynthesis